MSVHVHIAIAVPTILLALVLMVNRWKTAMFSIRTLGELSEDVSRYHKAETIASRTGLRLYLVETRPCD
jgi:hypothetical protein